MRNPIPHQQWMHRPTRASERQTVRARLSGFFNGVSVIGSEAPATKISHPKAAQLRLDTTSGHRARICRHSGLRSPTSTRSLIDPSSSTQSLFSPTSPGGFFFDQRDSHGMCCARSYSLERSPISSIDQHAFGAGAQQSYSRPSSRKQWRRTIASPSVIRRRAIRVFMISSSISGIVLVLLLIICKLGHLKILVIFN